MGCLRDGRWLRRCNLVFHVNKDNAAGGRLGLRWDALRLFSGCL
ncbi:hypothetical protein [Kingella sp. (in: b-proteobacteria)]|nr:hypothetical protein [Kingella sp. (in: b-proteobacteria)]MDO4658045.1 hypothetical protein [Kingella sp. (in: b-proteobacteria)]